jgi:uncharacterized protein YerC
MSTSLTLYAIEENLAALMESEGCIEDEQTRLAWLDDLAKANEVAIEKRDSVIRFLRHLDLQEQNIDAEITRLQTLKASYESGRQRVEKYVIGILESLPEPKKGKRKLEGSVGVLSLAKNPDKVQIAEDAVIPYAYQDATVVMSASEWNYLNEVLELHAEPLPTLKKTTMSPRRAEIKKALEAGEEIAGCDIAFGDNRLVVK